MNSQWKLVFRVHAIQRMFERNVLESDVRWVLENGEVIEEYKEDCPYPSKLVLGWIGKRPLHVVVADNFEEKGMIVITAYEPTTDQWSDNFRKRKK